jgi:putative FmdB family regulatory protein
MPRYKYECSECQITFTAFHSFKEILADCEHCETKDSLKKLLNTPFLNKNTRNKKQEVGEITKKYIEENREILKKQKEEVKKKKYDKT